MPVVLFATSVLINVVRGVMTIEPPTALMVILLAKPVVMSVPPVITKLPVPPTRVNPPVGSVTAEAVEKYIKNSNDWSFEFIDGHQKRLSGFS